MEECRYKLRKAEDQGPPPEARKKQEMIPPRVSEEAWPWQLLDFRLLASRHNKINSFF